MAVERKFIVKLLADPSQVIKGFNQVRDSAGAAFGEANTKIQNLAPAFQKVAAASAVAFAGLTAAAGVAIKAAVDAQSEQNRLRQILINTGGATEDQVKALINQAQALEKVGVASAGNIITLQSQLATFDLQFETIQRLTPAITDYVIAEKGATATSEDFKSMTNALAQALQGNFAALTKSGFVLDETTKNMIKNGTEAQRSAALVDVLNSTYKDFNITARDTAQGRMVALRNSFNSVREEIGMALLPAFERMIGVLQKFADFALKNTDAIVAIGTAMAVFTGTIVAASVAFKLYAVLAGIASTANVIFGTTLAATGVGAIIVLIGLLVAGFVVLVQKTGGVSNAFKAMGNFVIGIFEFIVNSFISMVNILNDQINKLTAPFRWLGINIAEIGPIAQVSFKRFSLSVKATEADLSNANAELERMKRLMPVAVTTGDALVTVAKAQDSVAAATTKVDGLRRRAKAEGIDPEELSKALKEQSDAQKVLNDLLGETAKKTGGVSAAKKEAKSRLEQYTDVLKSAQGQSDNYERSTRRLRDAKKSLQQADEDLTAAQEALTRAQQAGSPAEIADAERALAAAERQVTRGKFAGEQAAFAVADAEKKLSEMRAKGESSAQEIRQAEIALAEAKLRVVDTEDDQIKTARSLREAQRQLRIATQGLIEGDRELEPFKKAVTRAEEAQIRAAEQYTDALKEQKNAVIEYQKALDDLATAILKFPKIAERLGSPGIVPIVPTPTGGPGGFLGDQRTMPDKVEITVNSSVVNPAQVGQEIYEFLQDYSRVGGDLRFGNAIAI